jgi:hypothetical protein
VRGSGLENVESLPPDGFEPKLGVFSVSADKTYARLEFDTKSLPNGTLLSRIIAFDKPSGSGDARQEIAMATRQWLLRNNPEPVVARIPPASYMPEVRISYVNLPLVGPQPINQLRQLDDATFDSMLKNDWPRVEAILRIYVPANVVLMPPTPLNFHAAWSACLDRHGLLACKEAMLYLY